MMKTRSGLIAYLVVISLLVLSTVVAADTQTSTTLSSTGVQCQETSLGDLVSDAVREAVKSDIALVPAASFREITIPAGKVKPEDIARCLQYSSDTISVMQLTGDQLRKALERSVGIYPQKNLGFLQVSGLTVTLDPKMPKDERLVSVQIGKQLLDEDKTYSVATTAPLADGAYGYFIVWGKNIARQTNGNKTVSQAVSDFLATRSDLNYQDLNRIIQKKN